MRWPWLPDVGAAMNDAIRNDLDKKSYVVEVAFANISDEDVEWFVDDVMDCYEGVSMRVCPGTVEEVYGTA